MSHNTNTSYLSHSKLSDNNGEPKSICSSTFHFFVSHPLFPFLPSFKKPRFGTSLGVQSLYRYSKQAYNLELHHQASLYVHTIFWWWDLLGNEGREVWEVRSEKWEVRAMKYKCIFGFGCKCGCRCGTRQFLKK